MTRDAATVERHLRGLDAEACAAFVADLWAARGFETRRAGDVVVATRRGETRVLYPVPDARLMSPQSPDRTVDLVVDPRGRRAARRAAEAHEARLLDATDLRETLWYGVDRPVAADLCERHLGAPPSALAPPLGRRVRTAARGIESGAGPALVAGLVLLVVGALVAPALTAPSGSADGGTVAGGVESGAATASRPTGPSAVPGLDGSGIDDLTALASAHRRAVEGRSYVLWIDYRGPLAARPTTRIHRDVDVRVEGREYVAVTTVEGTNRTPTEVVYHARSGWYVARYRDGNVTYDRVGAGDGGPYGVPNPDETGRALVRRYLSTPETRIAGTATRGETTLYRVVGRGNPSGFGGERIGNYTATALVSPDGFVVNLTAAYTRPVAGRRVEVERRWTYGWIGMTTVTPPEWYDRKFGDGGGESGNESVGD